MNGSEPYDPVVGSNSFTIPGLLTGKEFYIQKVGYGVWPPSRYVIDRNTPDQTTITLTNGATFLLNEEFSIHLTGQLLPTDIPVTYDYTNGFNYSVVYNALKNRIGWDVNLLPKPVVDGNNQIALSQRHFHDFHAILTPHNIWQNMEKANATDAEFNSYLVSITRSAIFRCLNQVFRVPEYVQKGLVYDRYGQNDQLIEPTGKFIGYEINLAPVTDIGIRLDNVILRFNEDVTFNLYLFKDGKKSPVTFLQVSAVADEPTVVNTGILLNYIGGASKGGKFFFGYFQEDLGTAKAIREQIECKKSFNYVRFESVSIDKIPGQTNIDRDHRSYLYELSGFNMQVTVFKDHTNLITDNAPFFDEAIGLTATCTVIEDILYSVRSNGTQRANSESIDRTSLQMDLTGAAPVTGSPRIASLRSRLDKEFMRLRKTFYPCQRPFKQDNR